MDRIENLSDMVLDVLREIGNIGAGNAATALAQMIDKKVDMKVPKVNMMDFEDVPDLIGGAEELVSGIYFQFEGDIEGSIMFVLDRDSAINLINLLMPIETEGFDEMTISALMEIGNILSGSYIASLSNLTNLTIKISPPAIAIDMAGAILSVPAIEFGYVSDKILIIENEFFEDLNSKSVNGYFFLIPDIDSYERLMMSLGVAL
jgi:chemotaxis protein CheC